MTLTSTESADLHALFSKVNKLTLKVNWLVEQFPIEGGGDPPDLTELAEKVDVLDAGLNRVINLTVRGSETTSFPLTYESGFDMDGDTASGSAEHYASVVSLTLGTYSMTSDEATNGRNLKNVSQMARRQVAQHIIDLKNWTAAMGPAYYLAKGGIVVPNDIRPTDNADIQSARAYSETEIMSGFTTLRDLLRKYGVDLRSWRVREIDVGYGDPVTRVEYQATYGGIRANSHIDISSGFGKDFFPAAEDVHLEDHPGMHPRLPGFTVRTQPIETAIAERWIAIATQSPTDLRMKYHADLILLHSQDFDVCKVGEEIVRVLRHRYIPSAVFTNGIHQAIQRVEILKRKPEWDKVRAARPNMASFEVDQVLGSIATAYRHGVYAAFVKARDKTQTADFRRLRSERRFQGADVAAAIASSDNVVAFRPRGM